MEIHDPKYDPHHFPGGGDLMSPSTKTSDLVASMAGVTPASVEPIKRLSPKTKHYAHKIVDPELTYVFRVSNSGNMEPSGVKVQLFN